MPDKIIDLGDSPPPPDADLWLDYGRKLVQDAPASLRGAATALMTGLGALQGIYLGILGFAKFIPEMINVRWKLVFVAPLLLWMGALYFCLQVLLTEVTEVKLNSPSELREDYARMIADKQHLLMVVFWLLLGGLIVAIALVIFRAKLL
ncbi:MAG: hypothetical protein HY011_06015 [Acidobacteria bacterium]|nr:hypothetical protein [Acidobacteriota bacterium]